MAFPDKTSQEPKKESERRWYRDFYRWLAGWSGLSAAGSMALCSSVAVTITLGWGVGWAITIFFSSLLIESRTYFNDVREGADSIFTNGPFTNIKISILARELALSRSSASRKELLIPFLIQFKKGKVSVNEFRRIMASTDDADQHKKEHYLEAYEEFIYEQLGDWEWDGYGACSESLYLEKCMLARKYGPEIGKKQNFLFFAAITGLFNGILFLTVTFVHFLEVFYPAVTTIAAIPFLPLLGISLFTLLSSIAFGLLMYRTMEKMMLKNFVRLFNKIFGIYIPDSPFSEMTNWERFVHILRASVLTVIFLFVMVALTYLSFAGAGTSIEANLTFFHVVFGWMGDVINMLSHYSVYLFLIPAYSLFVLDNTWSVVEALVDKIAHLFSASGDTLSSLKESYNAACDDPRLWWKVPGYLFGCIIFAVAMGFNAVGEASFTAEGLKQNTSDYVAMFHDFNKVISWFFNTTINPVTFTVWLDSIFEVTTHTPFLLETHDHGKGIPQILRDIGYSIANWLFPNWFKKHEDAQVEKTKDLEHTHLFDTNHKKDGAGCTIDFNDPSYDAWSTRQPVEKGSAGWGRYQGQTAANSGSGIADSYQPVYR